LNTGKTGTKKESVQRFLLPAIVAAIIAAVLSIALSQGVRAAGDDDKLQPLITTSELIVGPNRFAFGLARAGKLIEKAEVLVRLYDTGAGQPVLVAETNALYRPLANVRSDNKVHRHADGTRHVHDAQSTIGGVYVSQLEFPRAGEWGLEIIAGQGSGAPAISRLSVVVQQTSPTLPVGSPAPKSRNLVAADVKDLRQIDTSARPDPRLHQVRIADAIAMGKPQLIVFATPQFCTSRMCGPIVDIVRTLLPAYGKQVAFTHQEIWQDFAEKKVFPTVMEWRLQSEPWIFIVDGQGIIRAKFEGLVTAREIETALQKVLLPATIQR
jgi:hypothetical protein